MDTATAFAVISVVMTMAIQIVIFTWKSGAVIRSFEQKVASMDKKLSIEIAEIKVRLDDLFKIGKR